MSKVFSPPLDVLPEPQRKLWPELAGTPDHFILYGGTAIALRLGHRQSVDFDFFSPMTFEPHSLLKTVPYLKDATVRKSAPSDLAVTVDRGGPVQLSFFGNFDLGRVAEPEFAEGPRIKVASLIDLARMKAAAVVRQRAEVKDYADIDALLTKSGVTLADMLAAGATIYGDQFSPLLSLKAIAYHDDPSLARLPMDTRNRLSAAVQKTDPARLPTLKAIKAYVRQK
jgi:Nucleotidyl transferase AbiEii toxin, Type IV TA system